MLKKRPLKRIGRMPIRRMLVSIKVDYYDVVPKDSVRLYESCGGEIVLSGWPRAEVGEKRPREKTFVLDDETAKFFMDKIAALNVSPLLDPIWDGRVEEIVKIEFGQGDAISKFFWQHSAPPEWRALEKLAHSLVSLFHDMCKQESAVNLS